MRRMGEGGIDGRIPSRKTLVDAFGEEVGAKLRRILEGDESVLPQESDYRYRHMYRPPRKLDRILDAANEAMGGHGTEGIRCEKVWDPYFCNIIAVYVNMGDTYDTTLLYNTDTDSVVVTSFGDWVERNDRRYGVI